MHMTVHRAALQHVQTHAQSLKQLFPLDSDQLTKYSSQVLMITDNRF